MKKHLISLCTAVAVFALALWLLYDVGLAHTAAAAEEVGLFSRQETPESVTYSSFGLSLSLRRDVLEKTGAAAAEGARLYSDLVPLYVRYAADGCFAVFAQSAGQFSALLAE